MYRARLPRRGKTYGRPCKLYEVWVNIKGRLNGNSTRSPEKYKGLTLGFSSYDEFRKFALANGFSKQTPSPDRIKEKLGYVPGNIRFTTVLENVSKHLSQYQYQPGGQPPGPEPPPYFDDEEIPF